MEGLIKINGFYINLSQVRAFATGKYTLVYMNDVEYKFEGEEAEALKLWLESQYPLDLLSELANHKELQELLKIGGNKWDAKYYLDEIKNNQYYKGQKPTYEQYIAKKNDPNYIPF